MLFRGLILEGVACAGKSSLLRALLTHPAFLDRPGLSSIVLTEHQTQRVLESRGPRCELRVEDNVALLATHVDYLRGVHGRLAAMRQWEATRHRNPCMSVILERFHLTHALVYEHMQWEDVRQVDEDLARLGFALCLVVASDAELRRRIADRGREWGAFLGESGVRDQLDDPRSIEAKAEHFVRQQAALRALASRTRLPVTEIDTSTKSPLEAAGQALSFSRGRAEAMTG